MEKENKHICISYYNKKQTLYFIIYNGRLLDVTQPNEEKESNHIVLHFCFVWVDICLFCVQQIGITQTPQIHTIHILLRFISIAIAYAM